MLFAKQLWIISNQMAEISRLNPYLRKRFGRKVYKLSLNGGMTCPNRDGTLGTRGCIFCSAGGSGEFAASSFLPISEQIKQAKTVIADKIKDPQAGYIAYFQAFTNTYAEVGYLQGIFSEAISPEDIVALSIGTRPDCIDADILELLRTLNAKKPVFVELGLQTIHPHTADFIRRGYPLACFDTCVKQLHDAGIEVIVHLILGLPGERPEDMIASIRHINTLPISGVKLQLLHVLKNTDLADYYTSLYTDNIPNSKESEDLFHILTLEEYALLLKDCIEHLRPDIVIHRLTGDGAKSQLLAPLWSANKKHVLNYINQYFDNHSVIQGRRYHPYGN